MAAGYYAECNNAKHTKHTIIIKNNKFKIY